jgi:hypothetical protein
LDQVDQQRLIVGLMKFGFHTVHPASEVTGGA